MGTEPQYLPLLKGTLDLLVLKTLSFGAQHGYAIASWLERRSDGALWVEDSALYQALHRLEGRGLVTAEWGITDTNRRARFYERLGGMLSERRLIVSVLGGFATLALLLAAIGIQGAAVLLTVVALVAAVGPARNAVRVDPATALRAR